MKTIFDRSLEDNLKVEKTYCYIVNRHDESQCSVYGDQQRWYGEIIRITYWELISWDWVEEVRIEDDFAEDLFYRRNGRPSDLQEKFLNNIYCSSLTVNLIEWINYARFEYF